MGEIIIVSDFTLYNFFIRINEKIKSDGFSIEEIKLMKKSDLIVFEFFNSCYFWDEIYMLPYDFKKIKEDLEKNRIKEDKKTTKETLFEDLFTPSNIINEKTDDNSDLLFIKQILKIDNKDKEVFIVSETQKGKGIINLDKFSEKLIEKDESFKVYIDKKYNF